jgi:hypothetical protein
VEQKEIPASGGLLSFGAFGQRALNFLTAANLLQPLSRLNPTHKSLLSFSSHSFCSSDSTYMIKGTMGRICSLGWQSNDQRTAELWGLRSDLISHPLPKALQLANRMRVQGFSSTLSLMFHTIAKKMDDVIHMNMFCKL